MWQYNLCGRCLKQPNLGEPSLEKSLKDLLELNKLIKDFIKHPFSYLPIRPPYHTEHVSKQVDHFKAPPHLQFRYTNITVYTSIVLYTNITVHCAHQHYCLHCRLIRCEPQLIDCLSSSSGIVYCLTLLYTGVSINAYTLRAG